jgi:hypothetical protein
MLCHHRNTKSNAMDLTYPTKTVKTQEKHEGLERESRRLAYSTEEESR